MPDDSSSLRPPSPVAARPSPWAHTRSVALRPLVAADAPDLARFLRDNEDWLRPWSPAGFVRDEDECRTDIEHAAEDAGDDRRYVLGVFLHEAPHRVAGTTSLSGVARGPFESCWLGYRIARDETSRGVGTEAAAASIAIAIDTLRLHRVEASVMPSNAPSLRVIDKLDLRSEGIALRYLRIAGRYEDHRRFAITAEEWHDRREEWRARFGLRLVPPEPAVP